MVRTQIQLTEAQVRVIKEIARRDGVSMAEVIRRSIDRTIKDESIDDVDERRRRALSVVGRFHDNRGDVSIRHDDYLAEIYAEVGEYR